MLKSFNTGWFKKNINKILDIIDQVLADYMLSPTPVRISILILMNLRIISKSVTNSFMGKKQTYKKIQQFFERER